MDEQAKKYINSQSSSFYNTLLKRCMGRGHKKTKYLFNPRITEEWREGGTLVVGINHWCTQKECEHYADCVLDSNSRKYDKSCQWAVSEVDDTTGYDLRYTTYEAFNCYFSGFMGYESFKDFLLYITGTQDCMEPEEQKRYWNNLAFYNYIQHFTKMSLTHTSMYGVKEALAVKEDEDFCAFLDVLHDLKPKLVIVWHKEIKNLLLWKIKEGKFPAGRSLQLVDDLGVPTRSMFRFVYQEKDSQTSEASIKQLINTMEQEYGRLAGFSTEQIVLKLLRWSMFKTEEDLTLLTQLSVRADDLKNMLELVEGFAWNLDVVDYLVRRIQEHLGIAAVLENVPYKILHYKEEDIVYSNVQLQPKVKMQVRPLVGVYPQDCSHYSLKKYEEKDLLALTGLSFDGLRSKMYIEEGVVAQGFIIYIDEEHPASEAFFKHLFEGKYEKEGFSMIIMKCSQENDARYLDILKASNRLHTIKSMAIGNDAFLYIKLSNKSIDNNQVIIEDKEHRIYNSRLKSLLPLKLNVNSYDKVELERRDNETDNQKTAMEKQINQLVKEKIEAEDRTINRLTMVIYFAYRSGLLSIEPDKTIAYKKSFGPKACYNLFCRKVYDKVLSEYKGKREDVIKSIFDHSYVTKVSCSKTKADLEEKGLKNQVEIIKLCFNSKKRQILKSFLKRSKLDLIICN